jgi:hypothetical protein
VTYAEWRESLIPRAEAAADRAVGATQPEPGSLQRSRNAAWADAWDRVFLREMRVLSEDPFALAQLEVSP